MKVPVAVVQTTVTWDTAQNLASITPAGPGDLTAPASPGPEAGGEPSSHHEMRTVLNQTATARLCLTKPAMPAAFVPWAWPAGSSGPAE